MSGGSRVVTAAAVGSPNDSELLIRRARSADEPALARLAELDGAPVPAAPLLVGEVADQLWAAVSLVTLEEIADPFQPSAGVTRLVLERVHQLRGDADCRQPRRWSASGLGRRVVEAGRGLGQMRHLARWRQARR